MMRHMKTYIIIALLSIVLTAVGTLATISPATGRSSQVIASQSISLEKRYSAKQINDIFKDNILLSLRYMNGEIKSERIEWASVKKPLNFEIELQPNATFAFHSEVLPEYTSAITPPAGTRFNAAEGYLSSGYLYGDGVCHLASLINWVAQEAGLEVVAPVLHGFADIPEVPDQYDTSIYSTDANQNLYIRNPYNKSVILQFDYDGTNLSMSIAKG